MATLAPNSGRLVESQKGYDPRVIVFYFLVGALLLTLGGGIAYQQLLRGGEHHERERVQNQRRILMPGSRGNLYDREGRLIVGNRARFAAVLYLDELRPEFRREYIRIRKNYRETGDHDLPTRAQMEQIARASVVQRYLDQINALLGRDERVDSRRLTRHFQAELLLPFTLLDDLAPEDYARLLESLPVSSPLQVHTTSARYYPFGATAAHTLGYVGVNPDIEAGGWVGDDLRTFKLKGTIGRDGLEKTFDDALQGQAGGSIFRVDPSGYRINPPLQKKLPSQGHSITTSLDIDLQRAAEEQLRAFESPGAAVALDVNTGEVLVLASVPDYDPSLFSPRLSYADSQEIERRKAWANHAISSAYPPGSTFKILTSIAALRSGAVGYDEVIANCQGVLHKYGRTFLCYNGRGRHGEALLPEAIAKSCDIYFYEAGWRTSAERVAAEARRFGLHQPTGIELPNETRRMVIPDDAWKQKQVGARWFPGDTANMAIGQGYVLVTPLAMAAFTASVARGEVHTQPTLVHRPDAPRQRYEPIGLSPAQRAALIEGMVGCTTTGTAKVLSTIASLRVPGVAIAGKTGTAQIPGRKNVAWFICFAPAINPQIAIAVAIEGDTAGEEFGGGRYAAPVASRILQEYFRKNPPPAGADEWLASAGGENHHLLAAGASTGDGASTQDGGHSEHVHNGSGTFAEHNAATTAMPTAATTLAQIATAKIAAPRPAPTTSRPEPEWCRAVN
ncbi:peptidoglycan D,D-transpeptidase FtsI family protein [Cephaloticoccus primus]|uniref:peptidoglycan D,D-transpeptidase FtsI family protein n=1 Tax=Cephaloticoccus primus TaxID=1548207 RepID=UPI0008394746|nr:penicillin-binding transpeptidase domain-containing protein [Cephaloticoccus primus]